METNVICPVCNAHFKISENEHVVSNAVVIGKDSNLGNVFLKLEDARKQQLESRGIDTSKYFSIASPKGDDVLMRWNENGMPEPVDDNDPVIIAIRKAGNVPNRKLFRRWVMAQMFQGLSFNGWGRGNGGFTEWMKIKGYGYTWKQTIEELRVQAILAGKDDENFMMRNRWFNKDVLLSMCRDHITQLRDDIEHKSIHKCKGVPYKRIGSANVFVSDLESKVYNPLEKAMAQIFRASTPKDLYDAALNFYLGFVPKNPKFNQSAAWQDAFKGAGAYFTMRNLIMFHGANYVGCSDYSQSLRELDIYTRTHCGYETLGALKEMIRQNGINIKAKMAEWRK